MDAGLLECPLEPSQLINILHGLVAATTSLTSLFSQVEILLLQIAANNDLSINRVGEASQKADFSLKFWLSSPSTCKLAAGDESGLFAVSNLSVAISALQKQSRKGLKPRESELSLIWKTICDALTHIALQDAWSSSRSAQGFLSVPLCSIKKNG